jgi:PAS domain S-box-containing protein
MNSIDPGRPTPSADLATFGDTTRFRAILLVVFMSLAAGLYVFADRLALHTEQEGLHRLARSQASLIISFRNFYSSKLLPIVREHSQLSVTHDYKNQPAALPIPATLTLDLVDDIAKLHPEMNLRLISPYPFPWRQVQLAPFELEAMTALQASGDDEFLRLDDAPGGKVLRYAAPIRLAASCVGCHNSHPDSPKRDWKEGDVRGIQVMKLPLEGLTYNSHPQYYLVATLLLLAFGIAGGVLIRLHGRGVDALSLAQKSADGLRERQHALDAHAIVSIADIAGRIIYANDQFCAISGFSREELLGQSHRILKSGVHPDTFYVEMWSTIKRGEVWQGEICNRNKTGGYYWVKSTLYPFLDENGKPYQYIAIRTDITERKAVEGELIAKRAEAEAASRAKSDFLANMSHEIRTPMNGIIGMSDLALDAHTEEERQEYMKIVKGSAESLLGILNDILDFSKIEANKLVIERVGFDLRQTVSETLKTLGPRASEKGLELICDIAGDVPQHVLGDPTRLRQVLINLTGNAIKFTASGEICIGLTVATRTGDAIVLQVAVRDSGIGIAADKLDSIFEAFSQADASTTRQYGGTGLGLSISNRLVELMGGKLSVTSEPGKGSTFQFTLVLGLSDGSLALSQPVPSPVHTSETLRVLLVEDNPINQQLAIRLLAKWGHEVTLAVNGKEAVDRLVGGERYDIVLMDMQMPVMGGIESTRLIRAHEAKHANKRVPIMAMTANAMQGDRDACLAAGMDDYLSKPINQRELSEKLHKFSYAGSPDDLSRLSGLQPGSDRK